MHHTVIFALLLIRNQCWWPIVPLWVFFCFDLQKLIKFIRQTLLLYESDLLKMSALLSDASNIVVGTTMLSTSNNNTVQGSTISEWIFL